MEANQVLAVVLAIMAAEAHFQQFKRAIQHWAEVVTAGRLQTCAAWAHFQVRQRVRARQRQARKRRCIRNLLILGERLPGRRWWVYPRSSDWWDNFMMHIWGEEKWLENFRMSRAVAHQFGLARSTVAGIVVEVTRAITEGLLERVVYLRDPDKVCQGHRGGCQPQRARGRRLDLHRTLQKSQEPMVSLIQIDNSQCIKCVEIITLDFCFVMWVDNEPTVGDPVVVVSSSTDSEAESGEGQLPGPAPGPPPGDAWRRSPLERQMEDMRRTLKWHTYRLSFIERSVVRLRQMVQQSRGIGQRRRRRQDPQPAPRPSSPMAIVAEVGAYPNTPVITRSSGEDRCQGIFSAPMDCKAEASS
ncbi:UNVERIFIED_CONTAM: hypothetical protein K2H54_013175 [Gekko kuhli]